MDTNLKIALIHLNVRYGEVTANAKRLIALNREAAQTGHKIIVNTEMGLSGYSFDSAEEIRPHALAYFSNSLTELAEMAREFKAYICVGLALEDPDTGILTNSAVVFGPDGKPGRAAEPGKPVFCYHKINAEARWACPGDPCQDNVFSTPWGRVGVLICSDSYHGLLVRQTALKGADLILVPANWPPTGLDPREIWSIRARENGIYLAGCNRTGTDRTMDCSAAPSGLFSPEGPPVVCRTHPDSAIVSADIPLEQGKIKSARKQALALRRPGLYTPVYLDTRYATNDAKILTDWYGLNPPGAIAVTTYTAPAKDTASAVTCEMLDQEVKRQLQGPAGTDHPDFSLMIFPEVEGDDEKINRLADRLGGTLDNTRTALAFSRRTKEGLSEIILVASGQPPVFHSRDSRGTGPGPEGVSIVDAGPARIGICLPGDLCQPETGIAHAKLGCDLLVTSLGTLAEGDRVVMAGRCMDKLAVAGASTDTAFVCATPKGHARFAEALVRRKDPETGAILPAAILPAATTPGLPRAAMTLDTTELRKKIYQDRIDYHTLLAGLPA